MGKESHIQWTDATYNPIIGCRKVSPACRNCYAERLVEGRMGKSFLDIHRTKDPTFYGPLKWSGQGRSPGGGLLIFTCSLSDFFLEEADSFRDEIWEIIRGTPQHTYQILTKRPERIQECLPKDWDGGWDNVWLGTSIELETYLHRMTTLAKVPARVHFLSVEPLLGPIDFKAYQHGIWFRCMDWIIVGGESLPGGRPRPTKPEWVQSIRDQCQTERIPFFFKQWGGTFHCRCHGAWGCCLLEGQEWNQFPALVRQRAQPTLETF